MAIDLDTHKAARAARREGAGAGVAVRFGGQDFTLPAELPASTLFVLIDGNMDLAGLIRAAVGVWTDQGADAADREVAGSLVIEALMNQPSLPLEVLAAVRTAVADLFGQEQWARFNDLCPSLADLGVLLTALWAEYGVSLGEAFASSEPSPNGGTTSRPTSPAGTASTPAAPGLALASPAS